MLDGFLCPGSFPEMLDDLVIHADEIWDLRD